MLERAGLYQRSRGTLCKNSQRYFIKYSKYQVHKNFQNRETQYLFIIDLFNFSEIINSFLE